MQCQRSAVAEWTQTFDTCREQADRAKEPFDNVVTICVPTDSVRAVFWPLGVACVSPPDSSQDDLYEWLDADDLRVL